MCKAITLSLQSGNPSAAPHFYASYAHLFAVITGDYATAYQFGQLGVGLGERPAHRRSAGAGELVFASFVAHWYKHVSHSLAHYQRGLRASLEVGDFIHFGYCTTHGALKRLYTGFQLGPLLEEVRGAAEPVRAAGDHINASLLRCIERAIETLRGAGVDPSNADAARYDAGLDVAAMSTNPTLLGMHLIAKTMALYFSGQFDAALAASREAEPILPYQRGMLWSVEHAFYRGLLRVELIRRSAASEREALLASLKQDTALLRELSNSAPDNHAQRVALLDAEYAALSGDDAGALQAYDCALALAHEHGFANHEALASELCARFHRDAGRAKISRVYLLDAYHGYRRWGAEAKLRALEAEHGPLVSANDARGAAESISLRGTSTTIGGLDLATAVRVTQTIASELAREKLIERLMRSLVEHAGAQRGFLIIPNGEQCSCKRASASSRTKCGSDSRKRSKAPTSFRGRWCVMSRAVANRSYWRMRSATRVSAPIRTSCAHSPGRSCVCRWFTTDDCAASCSSRTTPPRPYLRRRGSNSCSFWPRRPRPRSKTQPYTKSSNNACSSVPRRWPLPTNG